MVILFRGEVLAVVREPEYAFIQTYTGLLRQLADLKRDAMSIEPAAYVADYERVVRRSRRLRHRPKAGPTSKPTRPMNYACAS